MKQLVAFLLCAATFLSANANGNRLTPQQQGMLDRAGLHVLSVRSPAPAGWQQHRKIVAQRRDGTEAFLMLDSDGNEVTAEDIASQRAARASEYYARFGALDPHASDVMARNPFRFSAQVRLVLIPRVSGIVKPEPSEPGLEDYSNELSRWEAYYDTLFVARREAIELLASELPDDVTILSTSQSTLRVEVPVTRLEDVVRLPRLAAAGLVGDDLESEEPIVDGNAEISLDTFREATPTPFDGNGNGARIGIGHYELNSLPKRPPYHAAWHSYSGRGLCDVDVDVDDDCACTGWGCTCIDGYCYGNHSTWTNAVLGAWNDGTYNPAEKLGAPDADIWSASLRDTGTPAIGGADFDEVRSWWSQNGVRIGNVSIGFFGTLIGKDEAVRDDRLVLVHSSGNDGEVEDDVACYDSTPNEICVGNYDDSTNNMAASSSWGNPTTTDREIPDLVAPGTTLVTYDTDGAWRAKSGTSVSSPMVASLAAVLHDAAKTVGGPNYYPTLSNYPELTKALLMASAVDDIADDGPVSDPGDPDDLDGAGGVRADVLFSMWDTGRWSVILANPTPTTYTWKTVNLSAGQTLRAFIAWSRCPSSTFADLNADLGVYVYNPAGSSVASGDSYDQTWEGVEYTAPSAGAYTIRLRKWYMDSCNGVTGEYVGLGYLVY